MNSRVLRPLVWGLGMTCAWRLWAGGSGLNTVLVVNSASTNSVQLGNYYREARQIPPQNVLRVNWSGGITSWSRSQFNTLLAAPLQGMISSRGLSNQIDYVALSMDFPYQVTDTNGLNSTTAALLYGFVPDDPAPDPGLPDSCSLPAASQNFFAGSEDFFRDTPAGASSNAFLAFMLTHSNLALAKQLVDHGVQSDATFPTQTVVLAKTSDPARNVRFVSFDNAIFNTRLRGNYSVIRTNSDSPLGQTNLLGYQTGLYQFAIGPNVFVPGAMADSLTSYGGLILVPNDHTTLLALINAGAAASYGTVIEPCNYLEKFPDPQNYFYQARGFNLAESYYQSLANPYQGLLVGEPLAAPFARPGSGAWGNLPTNSVLTGTTNLTLHFTANDRAHPLQQVDLFVDGNYFQTLTNLSPQAGDQLQLAVNGVATNFTVTAGASIKSVASNLTAVLDAPAFTNAAKITATAYGDRIELQSFDAAKIGGQLSVTSSVASATTGLFSSGPNFLDSVACGYRTFTVTVFGSLLTNTYLQLTVTKTNGAQVVVAFTNTTSGATLDQVVQNFMNTINATASLQGTDGLTAEDLSQFNSSSWDFNLRARGTGPSAAQILALVSGSFGVNPLSAQPLNLNLNDLQPRNHLYVTAGRTNLALTFALNSAALADGWHELAAVAYEGTHVRTQTRLAQTVRLTNSPLAAVFTTLVGDALTAVEATLQFSIAANTPAVSQIELFSTGGSLGRIAGQPTAIFSVPGTNLDLGLHPFYAVVTRTDGRQYRTETKWIRLVGPENPFPLAITASGPAVMWTATAGRSYDILTATNLTGPFQFYQRLTPANSAGHWIETNAVPSPRFYRVRTSF